MDKQIEIIDKIEQTLVPPWDAKGMSAEEYAKDLTKRWEGLDDIINGRRTDLSIVKSTITETLEFITWAYTKKELTLATALIKAHLQKAKGIRHGRIYKGKTEGNN